MTASSHDGDDSASDSVAMEDAWSETCEAGVETGACCEVASGAGTETTAIADAWSCPANSHKSADDAADAPCANTASDDSCDDLLEEAWSDSERVESIVMPESRGHAERSTSRASGSRMSSSSTYTFSSPSKRSRAEMHLLNSRMRERKAAKAAQTLKENVLFACADVVNLQARSKTMASWHLLARRNVFAAISSE